MKRNFKLGYMNGEITMRHLLCQVAIFHRTTCTTCGDIQIQPFGYLDEQMEQRKSVIMKNWKEMIKFVSNRQDNDLWVKMPSPDKKK